jgi:hypothetical protein
VERRLDVFQERVLALGERLGCVRVVVDAPRDDGLLELVLRSSEPRIRWAFDLRDPSWDGVEERLSEVGAVRVGDESGGAGWAYLRFRELEYADRELDGVAARVAGLTAQGVETFAFFRHGDAPDAVRHAFRVLDRRGDELWVEPSS